MCTSVVLLAACGGEAEPPTPPPPAVEYHEVGREAVAFTFEFVARTRASEDTAIQARVTGNIIERNFDEGQEIEAGALMYRIDPRPYQAALASAKAELSNAKAVLDNADRNLKRGLELEPDGYISVAEMDKLRAEFDRATAAREVALAAIDNAQINLDFTELRAPFTGIAGRSNFSTGDLVGPQAGALVTLVQRDPMLVDFDVDEQALAQSMKANQARTEAGEAPIVYVPKLMLVTGDIYPQVGEIDYASNRVNPTTGTITITARFPNANDRLIPGQFARVLLQRGEAEMQLLVPQPSVLEDMQGRYVYTVNSENRVVRKNVKLGQRDGVNWVVESGLDDGDRVIVNGVQKVRPNMPVNPTPVEAMPYDTTTPAN